MNTTNSHRAISPGRLLLVLAPVAVLAAVGYYLYPSLTEAEARDEMQARIFGRLLGDAAEIPGAIIESVDRDGDLLADPPPDEQCIAPETLVVSCNPSTKPFNLGGLC